MKEADRSVQNGYPLSALFVLLAVCAVVSVLLAPVARALVTKQVTVDQIALTSFLGLILVSVLGAVIGLYHYRPLRGAGWGVLTGGIIGVFIGPIMLAPPEEVGTLITVSVVGSVVLVITGPRSGSVSETESTK